MAYQRSVYRQQGWGTLGSYFLSLLFLYIFFSLTADAFQYLGFSPWIALLVLFVSVITSSINIPIKYLESKQEHIQEGIISFFGVNYRVPITTHKHETVLAINVGGGIIPIIISLILFVNTPASIIPSIGAIIVGSIIINRFAKPVKGIGIGIPLMIPALVAFVLGVISAIIEPDIAPVVAYATGVIGSLIGADVMNLDKVAEMGAPVASIGGAGTFDGIFISGVLSVVLLAIFGIV